MIAKHSREYLAYMHSEEWKQKRRERLEVDGYACCMCGKTAQECIEDGEFLHVHHVSYDRIFNEDVMHDLCTVCPDCHARIHRYYNRKRDRQYGIGMIAGEGYEEEGTTA